MSKTGPSIAIVGSGPAGCYTAQFLRRKLRDAEITIFESLPAPYGLLRYGVASDHQGTKSLSDQFDRLFEREDVRLAANVTIGIDLRLADFFENFDVVVRATGLQHDRLLPIGTDVPEAIVGAGSLLKALNGHPNLDPRLSDEGRIKPLGSRLAVIGMGNVAMDVVRMLCKTESGFAGSDVDDARLQAFKAHGISSVDIFSRSPISAAKFDLSMLKELVTLPHVGFAITDTQSINPSICKAADLLLDAARHSTSPNGVDTDLKPVRVCFHFVAAPRSLTRGRNGNTLTVIAAGCSVPQHFEVDTLISATGFTNCSLGGEMFDDCDWDAPNVFKVGWLNRQGKGTIAANRKDAKETAELIVGMLESGTIQRKGRGFADVKAKIEAKMIDFEGWREIDRYERANSPSHRCRRKLTNVDSMVSIAQREDSVIIDNTLSSRSK
jgi:ferredoxin/flavodoxin---NADP+ reductase